MEITKKVQGIRENAKKSYTTKMGTYFVHEIKLTEAINVEGDDVTEFEFHSTKDKVDKFVIGEEATFTVERKVNEYNGKTYTNYRIKPVETMKKAFGGGFSKATPKDDSVIAAQSILGYVLNNAQGTVYNREAILKEAEFFHKWVESKRGLWK